MEIADEKRERKLVYNRNLLREKRRQYLSERQALTDELNMLSKKLRVKLDKALLPWKDVVQGLQDDYEIQQNVTLALRTKTRKNSQVIEALSKWVNVIFAPKIGQSLQLPSETWRNVTLPQNPDIRRVGMDWITQQLYQNTDNVFYRHELPPTSNLNDFFIDYDESLSYVWRYQHDFEMPFEPFCDILRDTVGEFVKGGMWGSRFSSYLDDNVLPGITYARSIRSPEEAVNYLSRGFISADRAVFVGRNVLADEILPTSQRQSQRMFWYALEKLSPTQTRCRILILKSQDFTKDGYVSIDEEASYWGCDLSQCPEKLKLQTFRAHTAHVGRSLLARGTFHMEMRMLQHAMSDKSDASSHI
ncbi:hypothetical protein LEN26_007365 [Aphanomyces euteiches]|nr:hypothetical protein LEN26_007365 [Aphanomyces euteiches]